MKKFLIFLILLIPLNVHGLDLDFPEINSDIGLIFDLNRDKLIYEKNIDEKTSIASLTKILTVITALENITDLEAPVVITNNMLYGIYWNASVAGLKVGDTVTYRDLLYGAMLPSGADATHVLAISLGGNIKNFVAKMNALATEIGMENSHFVNVSGLDVKNQYSTARDVLTLLKYALQNETFKKIYTTKEYVLSNGLVVKSTIEKYNEKLNIDTSRIIGSKTGFTDAAGLCLSSLTKVNDHDMLIITIRADKGDESYNLVDNLSLLAFLDDNYITEIPVYIPEHVPIKLSLRSEDISINYKLIITGVVIIVLFPILVIPHRTKRQRKNKK